MQVREIEPGSESSWEAIVTACGGNALHIPRVHHVTYEPSRIKRLVFEENGRIVGCSIACEGGSKRLRSLLGRRRHVVLPTAPAIKDEQAVSSVREALFEYVRRESYSRLQIHPIYSRWIAGDEDLAPFRTHALTEFILDLRGGEDAVLANMHKNHRKSARRAAKHGLSVEERNDVDAFLYLRELQKSSERRVKERSGGFDVGSEDYFRRLYEVVYSGGPGHMLFAIRDDQAVAALAWLQAANRIQTVRSGALPEGYESRAMYLLYVELIRRAIRDGAVELNAGGVPAEAVDPDHSQFGLYEFKNGFGAEPITRHRLDIPAEELP